MAAMMSNSAGPSPHTPHTSGLFADMTLDGPEIGTLVLIVDRAKNLPNRKTMGKQNPYCAARLGKEARKTETDRRGGQTPRWDQELRFIVHDSPDYMKMKISVFSEDKRTDLVGEAWVELSDVIVPGGGKKDLWQELTFKGKYAGELRAELTYYDERPRPSIEAVAQQSSQVVGNNSSRVKRRPLPTNPAARNVTPDTIPQPMPPGRAKHGPRDLRLPPRANSLPPDMPGGLAQNSFGAPLNHGTPPAPAPLAYEPNHGSFEAPGMGQYAPTQTPDFLPQLPPSNTRRSAQPPQLQGIPQPFTPIQDRQLQQNLTLHHSMSAPNVPLAHEPSYDYNDGFQLNTDYADPIPDVEYQYSQLSARSHNNGVSAPRREIFDTPSPAHHYYGHDVHTRPPPPPVHSNSSPAAPQMRSAPGSSPSQAFVATPPSGRPSSFHNAMVPSAERRYGIPARASFHGSPAAATTGPNDVLTPSPQATNYDRSSPTYPPGQTPSPLGRPQALSRVQHDRHSISDPYSLTTPPRPHPLSQEVPRSQSPEPWHPHDNFDSSPAGYSSPPQQPEYRSRHGLPLIRPRPVSPQAPQSSPQPPSSARSKSAYDIQFPIRAFESAEGSPLSTSQREPRSYGVSTRSTPIRKSISPHPAPPKSAGSMPYSPDSFNVHNPNAQETMLSNGNSPHSPYAIRADSGVLPRDEPTGPIVDWHGKEVDPSDRLPVDSWAPEPEKKTPVRTYGLGRDRDFGPRTPQSGGSSGGKNLSKDTVVNVRMRQQQQQQQQQQPPQPSPEPEPSSFRNRLQKRNAPTRAAPVQPLQERHDYNAVSQPARYEQPDHSPGWYGQGGERSHRSSPIGMSGEDALSREISSIDIGGGSGARHVRGGSVPAATAFVPVRSHKDRNTYY